MSGHINGCWSVDIKGVKVYRPYNKFLRNGPYVCCRSKSPGAPVTSGQPQHFQFPPQMSQPMALSGVPQGMVPPPGAAGPGSAPPGQMMMATPPAHSQAKGKQSYIL